HRRRPDREPGADALHHAGDLPRLRPPGPPPARRAARHAGQSGGPPGSGPGGGREAADMNLSAPFIARPAPTTPLPLGIAPAGLVAFLKLPVSPLPRVDFPTIQ